MIRWICIEVNSSLWTSLVSVHPHSQSLEIALDMYTDRLFYFVHRRNPPDPSTDANSRTGGSFLRHRHPFSVRIAGGAGHIILQPHLPPNRPLHALFARRTRRLQQPSSHPSPVLIRAALPSRAFCQRNRMLQSASLFRQPSETSYALFEKKPDVVPPLLAWPSDQH